MFKRQAFLIDVSLLIALSLIIFRRSYSRIRIVGSLQIVLAAKKSLKVTATKIAQTRLIVCENADNDVSLCAPQQKSVVQET